MYLFKRSPSLSLEAESFSGIDCTRRSRSDLQSAVYMKNWRITDDGKLTKRNGYSCIHNVTNAEPLFVGNLGGTECFVYKKYRYLYSLELESGEMITYDTGEDLGADVFLFGGLLYIIGCETYVTFDGMTFADVEPYIPTVAVTAPNEGGGVLYEGMNLISRYAKIIYSPNGTSSEFILPEASSGIYSVVENGETVDPSKYIYDSGTRRLTLNYIPGDNIANSLEVTFTISSMYLKYPILHKKRFCIFGASGDTRVFAYGNDNVVYYSDVTVNGADPLYFPSENFIMVGDGSSCVTGMCRQYSTLAVFTEKDAWYISPSSVDYDGYSKPSFPILPLNSKIGCIDEGTVLVNNSPLTVSESGVYLWNSTTIRDERNAKLISLPVENSVSREFLKNSTVFDHEGDGEVWICNDGEVLVYNYKRGAWYTFDNIPGDEFFEYGGQVYFTNKNGLYRFSSEQYTDDGTAYSAVWESAFADFGTYDKKTVRRLSASFVPQINSDAIIKISPSRGEKAALGDDGCFENRIFSFLHTDFSKFSFECEGRPRIVTKRLNMRNIDSIKVRIENNIPDSRCTVDSLRIQVRL